MDSTLTRVDAAQRRLAVYWLTVAFFAVVIAFGDGFWVTSVQGAVGSMERNDPPFSRWLRDSAMMVPLYFLAVLAAILLGRRWFGHRRNRLAKFGGTALLMVLLSSAVAISTVAASSAYDYRLQSRDLVSVHAFHQTIADPAPGASASTNGACTGICAEKQLTLNTHLKALRIASVVLLLSNVVLVLWVMVLRGDRMWRSPRTPNASSEASVGTAVAGAML
ncbi:MAG TPA: hypothetical protein VFE86_20335 [Ilumatobacteraceae bacterium]|nr:hypothetical protein [Ilumatobacteraceae bacterium]